MKSHRNCASEKVIFLVERRRKINSQQTDPLANQNTRLLAALQKAPVSTLAARTELDVLHPAARVRELREQGQPILTRWIIEKTALGTHRVAEYVLCLNTAQERQVA